MSHTTSYLQSLPTLLDADISTLVNYLVHDAVQAGASDIHIEPWHESMAVRVRVAGQLIELVHLPSELKDKIAGRFKVMASLASHLSGVPQDGKVNMGPEFGNVQLRVSIFPTVLGEKVVCRIFDPTTRSFDIDRLGLDPDTKEKFVGLVNKPNGLILLTGPTGSGKTTAIYCALHYLLAKHGTAVSIASVEDPVEVPIPTVSQAQLNPAQDFTFAGALRSLMRQDPQIIMVGEIRDPETAGIAVQAGLTGHLVISTVHSGTTAGVFARLINMGIEPFLLASSILGVMGVRLVRQNCSFCAIPYEPEPALLRPLSQERLLPQRLRLRRMQGHRLRWPLLHHRAAPSRRARPRRRHGQETHARHPANRRRARHENPLAKRPRPRPGRRDHARGSDAQSGVGPDLKNDDSGADRTSVRPPRLAGDAWIARLGSAGGFRRLSDGWQGSRPLA
jgi:type II secretory ATPase GspE/PulE/Tfp pilus assembly ATPase PilB-like protein